MANPAELLHQQLLEWSDLTGEYAGDKRGLKKGDRNAAAWEQHRIAVRHLLNIEEALRWAKADGKDVAVYEEHIAVWTSQIFAFPSGWYDRNAFSITKVPMDQLRSVKLLLDYVVPEFKPGGQDGFDNFLSVAAFKISQLDDEHEDLKNHALKILRHLKGCLDDIEIYGEFNIVNALSELKTILFALDKVSTPDDDFFARAKNSAWSFFKKGSVTALVLVGIPLKAALEAGGEDFYEHVVKPETQQAIEWATQEEITWIAPKEIAPGPSEQDSD